MSCFGVVWIRRTRSSIFNFEHWNFTPLWKFGKRADFETSRKWCSKWSSRIYVLFLFRVQRYIVGPCKDGIHATWSSTERSSASRSLQVSWKCRVCNDFVGTLSLEPQKNHGDDNPLYKGYRGLSPNHQPLRGVLHPLLNYRSQARWSQFPGFLTYRRWLRNHR